MLLTCFKFSSVVYICTFISIIHEAKLRSRKKRLDIQLESLVKKRLFVSPSSVQRKKR